VCRAAEPDLDIKEIISNRTASLDRSKVLRLECAAENPEGAPAYPPCPLLFLCIASSFCSITASSLLRFVSGDVRSPLYGSVS
jgi:hypothetical protein